MPNSGGFRDSTQGSLIKQLLGNNKDPILAQCFFWLAQYEPTAPAPPNWPTWTLWQFVVSDGSQDPECAFDDLGAALRKIRIDMGVQITIDKIIIYSRKSDKLGKYCAVGKIPYSEVDGGGPENDGTLIYIKPAICGGEPADVFNYAQQNKLFPHESTADQFFSESQFESYRMLGLHSVQQISEGWTGATLQEWAHPLSTVYLA